MKRIKTISASRFEGGNPAPRDGLQDLAFAVVYQGLRDAIRGDRKARAWLLTTGISWMQLCGLEISRDQVLKVIRERKKVWEKAKEDGQYTQVI